MSTLFLGIATILLTTGQCELDDNLAKQDPYSFCLSQLNDCELWLPAATVRTMIHCYHGKEKGPLVLQVETFHSNWMRQHLKPGSIFIDIGAATGAMTLPFGKIHDIEIVAYEPCAANRKLLEVALKKNGIEHAIVKPVAVSDQPGEFIFREFDYDSTHTIPFLKETSSLVYDRIPTTNHKDYLVRTVTLDEDLLPLLKTSYTGDMVIKIDVEGFEAKVLQGASLLINKYRPYLSIDIHADPFGEGTTESKVKSYLHNYSFKKADHVLLCTPTEKEKHQENPRRLARKRGKKLN